jgi:hypothetical protein
VTVAFPKPVSYPRKPTPMRSRRKGPRRSSHARDRAYLGWVRSQVCICYLGMCSGPVEAHHASVDHGLGQRGSDLETVPLCRAHHRAWTDHRAPFEGWTRADRRMIAKAWIRETQAAHGRRAA